MDGNEKGVIEEVVDAAVALADCLAPAFTFDALRRMQEALTALSRAEAAEDLYDIGKHIVTRLALGGDKVEITLTPCEAKLVLDVMDCWQERNSGKKGAYAVRMDTSEAKRECGSGYRKGRRYE